MVPTSKANALVGNMLLGEDCLPKRKAKESQPLLDQLEINQSIKSIDFFHRCFDHLEIDGIPPLTLLFPEIELNQVHWFITMVRLLKTRRFLFERGTSWNPLTAIVEACKQASILLSIAQRGGALLRTTMANAFSSLGRSVDSFNQWVLDFSFCRLTQDFYYWNISYMELIAFIYLISGFGFLKKAACIDQDPLLPIDPPLPLSSHISIQDSKEQLLYASLLTLRNNA